MADASGVGPSGVAARAGVCIDGGRAESKAGSGAGPGAGEQRGGAVAVTQTRHAGVMHRPRAGRRAGTDAGALPRVSGGELRVAGRTLPTSTLLLIVVGLLCVFGLVMVGSASSEISIGEESSAAIKRAPCSTPGRTFRANQRADQRFPS